MKLVKLMVCDYAWDRMPSTQAKWHPHYLHPDEIRRAWDEGDDFHYIRTLSGDDGDRHDLRVQEPPATVAKLIAAATA